MSRWHRPLLSVLYAVALVAAATILRGLLTPWLGADRLPWVFYFPAVMVAGLLGEWVGAAVALAVSAVVGSVLFMQPPPEPVAEISVAARVIPYLISAGAVGAFSAASRGMAQRRAEAERLAERRLRELRDIYAAAPVGLAFLDTELSYVKINEALAAVNGHPAEAHIGRSVHEILPPDAAARLEPLLRGALAGEAVRNLEQTARDPSSGRDGVWLFTAVPVRDSHGRVLGVQTMLHDITERTQTEERLRRSAEEYRALFELGGAGRMQLDTETGKIVRVNEEFCRMIGYSEAELLGRTPTDLTHPDDAAETRRLLGTLARGETDRLKVEKRYVHKDGSTLWVHISSVTLRENGGAARTFADIVDITGLKSAQEEVERRATELVRSNEELESFAYAASHDLKEPLRGIANYAKFLDEDHGKEMPGEARDKIETIRRLSVRLSELLDAMLEYSRAGRGTIGVAPISMDEVVSAAVQSLGGWLAAREAAVQVEAGLPTVQGDPARLEQVFRNLIVNGIKYNESARKRVEIGFEGGAFFVRDNGIGIDARHQERVFEIFRRLHPRDRYGGGSGVGLALVRRIVERHGGRVWLDSKPGDGSTFWIAVPLAEPEVVVRPQTGQKAKKAAG